MLTRMVKIKKLTIASVGKKAEQCEWSYSADENVNWYNHCGKVC